MKKSKKSEKDIQFELKMKELAAKEKATRKENKVKYGPGRRGVIVTSTAVISLGIAVAGVWLVQTMLKDDKYQSGNEVVTTSSATTTALSVPTGYGTTSPVEIYPAESDDGSGDDSSDGYLDDLLEGGFNYKPVDIPQTSATTTVAAHDVQMTSSDNDIFTGGMGGEFYYDDPVDGTTAFTSAPSRVSVTATSASTPAALSTSSTSSTTATPSVASTPANTATPAVSGASPKPPTGTVYVDPESTYGYNANEYLN